MQHETLLRQVTLISYGTKFLRKEIELDAWYRHGIFARSRLLFRDPAGNQLLADDFTLWLGILRAQGAHRLTLHAAADFKLNAERAVRGEHLVVAVHFADSYQLLACCEERANWWKHPSLPKGGYQYSSDCPGAAYYGGEIDTYWRLDHIAGRLDVPETDWSKLAERIRDDVEMTVVPGESPSGAFTV